AVADPGVRVRPVSDTMAEVTVRLPMAQSVGIYAACKRQADMTFDDRSRGQVMADTVYERVTGRPADAAVPISLSLVLADTTLFGGDDCPGYLAGYGPVPAAVVRHLVTGAVADARAKAGLRRLYRHPDSGQLVAMESRARLFPKGLAAYIGLRDQSCRTPYCNAAIRHHDHATPHRSGGHTTAVNGLGLCEACNYAKEAADWTVTTRETGGQHSAVFRTPTGATYESTAPPLPGPPPFRRSIIENGITIDLVTFDAA
ncbi:HNH endonuclease, partial [Mycolicibacterium vaccae]|uniref:HNH endonuclease n=1 Tax=Mycolicibacterium vaccae TaxID=1810 RepID=UPI003D05BFDA